MTPSCTPWFIAIGASGSEGLKDIRDLLARLDTPLAAVVLVVLHRPWDQPSHLKAILGRASELPVLIAAEGEHFEVGSVYIGEPEAHLTLVAKSFGELIDDPQQLHRNRTVDLLFGSVAAHAQGRVIGVVLSGALDDGSRGLAAIHAAGGKSIVLTPHPSDVRGMQRNAIDYDGLIDLIGDADAISAAVNAIVGADQA